MAGVLWRDGVRRGPAVERDRPAYRLGGQDGFRASAYPRPRPRPHGYRSGLRFGCCSCRHTVAYKYAISSEAERSLGLSGCRGFAGSGDIVCQLRSGKACIQNRSADCHTTGINATERQPYPCAALRGTKDYACCRPALTHGSQVIGGSGRVTTPSGIARRSVGRGGYTWRNFRRKPVQRESDKPSTWIFKHFGVREE